MSFPSCSYSLCTHSTIHPLDYIQQKYLWTFPGQRFSLASLRCNSYCLQNEEKFPAELMFAWLPVGMASKPIQGIFFSLVQLVVFWVCCLCEHRMKCMQEYFKILCFTFSYFILISCIIVFIFLPATSSKHIYCTPNVRIKNRTYTVGGCLEFQTDSTSVSDDLFGHTYDIILWHRL